MSPVGVTRTIAVVPNGDSARGVAIDSEGNILVTAPETKKLHIFAVGEPQHYLLRSFSLKDYSYAITIHATMGVLVCGYNSGQVSRLCHLEMASVSQVLGPGGSKMKSSVQQVIAGTKYKIGKLGV